MKLKDLHRFYYLFSVLIKTEIDGSNSKNEVQYYYQINLPSDLIEIDSNFKKLGLI